MLNKPEEIILSILGIIWIIATIAINYYLGVNTSTFIFITLLNIIWVTVVFLFWQKDKIYFIWPIFLGLLIACWWPILDWYAIKPYQVIPESKDAVLLSLPWYATWTTKILISLAVTFIGYLSMFFSFKKTKN